jgi:hypothetical protein
MAETYIQPLEREVASSDLGPADVAVAVTTYNNAATIGAVVRAVEEGLVGSFPGRRALLLHADGGSNDGTPAVVAAALADQSRLVRVSLASDPVRPAAPGPPTRAQALRLFFGVARRLGVRGCAFVNPDLTGLEPEAVGRLLLPVLDRGLDFVGPYYSRPRFAGAITTSIVYPLTRALYGRRMRYPAGGEVACSARLVDHCLSLKAWSGEGSRFATDLWLTNRALLGGFRLGQAWVGHRTTTGGGGDGAGSDLSHVLTSVLGALFSEAERNPQWQRIRGSEPVELFGTPEDPVPEAPGVDLTRSLESFRLGQQHLKEVWDKVLPPMTALELRKLARRSDAEFRLDDQLWARTVYDFLLAYYTRVMSREHLLPAFTPLYLGWLGSFVSELHDADQARIEQRIEELCLRFEAEKPYLISRWRSPDRFNP